MGKVKDFAKKAGGNLIGGATNAVTGALGLPSVGDLLSGPDLPDPRFANINAGGLNVNNTGEVIDVSSGRERLASVGGIRDVLNQRAEQLAQLRGQVQPGFGALTEARLGEIENARRRTIGNLRENLQRRRVLGSSFGQDVLSRAEAEFGQEAGQARARSFLEELDVQTQLIGQEFDARRAAIQTSLDNLNLEAELGAQLAGAANSILENNAQAQAELASSQIAGLGQLAGTLGAASIPLLAASDRRLKRDASVIGHYRGIPVYLFRYNWDDIWHVGHMADEVETVMPAAVLRDEQGYAMVDYRRFWNG